MQVGTWLVVAMLQAGGSSLHRGMGASGVAQLPCPGSEDKRPT
jgi:hypothetical protein